MKETGKLRLVRINELPEDLKPWVGAGFKGSARRIKDTPFPYTTDGFIDPHGWFFAVPAYGHDQWCRDQFGVFSTYLAKSGWVIVWSYESMFKRPGKNFDVKFRWESEIKLTPEQKHTMVRWCEAQKLTLKQALNYKYDEFMEES